MILKYPYWYFKSAIPEYFCDQIVEMGLRKMYDERTKFGDHVIAGTTGGWRQRQSGKNAIPANNDTAANLANKGIALDDVYLRDSSVTFLNDPNLYDIVWPFIREANQHAGWNFDWDYTEDMQFTKYGVDQFYGWHSDSSELPYRLFDPEVDPVRKNTDGSPYTNHFGETAPEDHHATDNPNMIGKIRKLSVTVSLNDPDYEGGNLQFDLGAHRPDQYHTCTEIRPKGSIIVFPSHVPHQVTPVTRGTRYSLVSWSLGAPFK
jgi:PKHD-type hydroxylase|tara:strand:+ start:57 stop:842 length:786 start_codon:yes stop_codon:yes gene_type:complete